MTSTQFSTVAELDLLTVSGRAMIERIGILESDRRATALFSPAWSAITKRIHDVEREHETIAQRRWDILRAHVNLGESMFAILPNLPLALPSGLDAAPVDPAPAAVDTGRAHGPSFSELLRASHRAVYAAFSALVFDGDDWTPETEAPYRDVQRRHYALCQHIPSPFTVVEPTPAAIIAAVPQTVIAENDAIQLLADDGAAVLAAHDRKQALRTAHNELDRWFAAAPLNERQAAFRDAMHAALDRIHAAGASPERIADAAYALKHADCWWRLNAVADQYAA